MHIQKQKSLCSLFNQDSQYSSLILFLFKTIQAFQVLKICRDRMWLYQESYLNIQLNFHDAFWLLSFLITLKSRILDSQCQGNYNLQEINKIFKIQSQQYFRLLYLSFSLSNLRHTRLLCIFHKDLKNAILKPHNLRWGYESN